MRTAGAIVLLVLALGLGACSGGDGLPESYPPLPGPQRDAEVIAVSPSIATSGAPVFYVYDSDDRHKLIAYDWQGKRRGEIVVVATEAFGFNPSADGTRILVYDGHVMSGGMVIGWVAPQGSWAGDNEHLCTFLNEKGGPGAPQERKVSVNEYEGRSPDASLFLEDATGPTRRVMSFGSFGDHGGPQVLACNASANRAVLTETFVGTQSRPEMVRLSDGQVIYAGSSEGSASHLDYVASPDGSLLAEGGGAYSTDTTFIVRAIPAGNVVAKLLGGAARSFSGDNSRVLTVEYLNGSNEQARYQVVEIGTGRVVWSAVMSPGWYLTRPGSADLIVAGSVWEDPPPGSNTRRRFYDIWLVPGEGEARLLLKHSGPIGFE